MPRPVQLPIAAWLIWQRPQIRVAFVVMFVIHGVAVVLSGLGSEWLEVLQSTPGDQVGLGFNFALSRWLGLAWVPIGLTIGIICFWRDRLGLASLAISPYLLPSYLLAGFWEWRPRDPH
jgi:hypothetical protein